MGLTKRNDHPPGSFFRNILHVDRIHIDMRPDIRIFKDQDELSQAAAELFVAQADAAIRARGRFLVVLNGGSTPVPLFKRLAADFREKVDWSNTHIFWGDERSVLYNDPESSYGQAQHLFLQHVPIPEMNIHPIDGRLDPAQAAQEHTQLLAQFADTPFEYPRFDLVYLGMGEDGHTASLFPGSTLDVTEPVIPVTAHYQDRPARRITMTPVVLNHARMLVFMATGAKKAATLAEVLGGRFNPEHYPAQRIEPKDGKLIWLVDEDAAGRLPLSLIRKFCEG
jgi:6-phosphogluconolactonase